MDKILLTELVDKLNDEEFMKDIKTISIIHDNEYRLDFAVYFDDLVCMSGVETSVSNAVKGNTVEDFDKFAKKIVEIAHNTNILVFQFYDTDIPEIWKESYKNGGIPEYKWDRRVEFHKYNEPNEMFCVDWLDYMQIIGEIKEIPDWKKLVIEWYRNNMLNNGDD